MQENIKKPAIRFDGFTDAWEQRKVADVASFTKGSGYSKSDIRDKGVPLILYGRLYTKYETVIREVDTYAVPKDGSVYSRGGEVIVPASGETAEDISIASVVEKSGVLLGGDLNIVTPGDEIDSAFLALSISYGRTHRDLSKLAQGKSVVHIHNSDIQSVDLRVPKLCEQEKIGNFFIMLDDLITLHQRDKSSRTALGSVERKEKANAWEQREFGEIVIRSSEMSNDYSLPRVEYEDIISGIGLLNKDITKKMSCKVGLAFHDGDVLYGKLRPYLKNWLLPSFSGIAVGDFWVMKPQEADSSFVYRLIQTQQFDEIANQSTGTKMPRADWKLVSKSLFRVPSSIHEQAKIGHYFSALDDLITLHQRECIYFVIRST